MTAYNASILSTREISRAFGGVKAVSNLSFDIRPGEVLGLIGPNGAGKSTTFNLISGFYKPTSGACISMVLRLPAVRLNASVALAFPAPSSTAASCRA